MELDSWNLIIGLGWGSAREDWEGVQEWGDAYHGDQEYSDWCVGWNDFKTQPKKRWSLSWCRESVHGGQKIGFLTRTSSININIMTKKHKYQ